MARIPGGSVMDWVMRAHKVSFRHACELLAKEHPALAAAAQGTTTAAAPKLSQGKLRAAQSFSLDAVDQALGVQRVGAADLDHRCPRHRLGGHDCVCVTSHGDLAAVTVGGTTATPKSIQDLQTVWRSNSTLYRRIDKRNTPTTADDCVDTLSYDARNNVTQIHVGPNHILLLLRTT